MNSDSPIALIGIGTAGASIARNVNHAFGGGMRCILAARAASGQAVSAEISAASSEPSNGKP